MVALLVGGAVVAILTLCAVGYYFRSRLGDLLLPRPPSRVMPRTASPRSPTSGQQHTRTKQLPEHPAKTLHRSVAQRSLHSRPPTPFWRGPAARVAALIRIRRSAYLEDAWESIVIGGESSRSGSSNDSVASTAEARRLQAVRAEAEQVRRARIEHRRAVAAAVRIQRRYRSHIAQRYVREWGKHRVAAAHKIRREHAARLIQRGMRPKLSQWVQQRHEAKRLMQELSDMLETTRDAQAAAAFARRFDATARDVDDERGSAASSDDAKDGMRAYLSSIRAAAGLDPS